MRSSAFVTNKTFTLSILVAAISVACGGGGNSESSAPSVSQGVSSTSVETLADNPQAQVTVGLGDKVSEKRVDRTVNEYVYKVAVQNGSQAVQSLVVTLNGGGKGLSVVQGSALVGDVAAGASAVSAGTITLRQDRTQPFDPKALDWSVNSAFVAAVPKANCRTADKAETGLAGEVPLVDRTSGRSAEGYNCNVDEVSRVRGPKGTAGANLDMYSDCLYWGDTVFGAGGTVVADVADPAYPVQTSYLTTPAMQAPWESLRTNGARGLLAANKNGNAARGALDVYDVKTDCKTPLLKASLTFETARGHEGWFQPDGMVYYMGGRTGSNKAHPIDLSEPSTPREMAHYSYPATGNPGIHGGSVSLDGKRGYFCNAGRAPNDFFVITDTTQVQARQENPAAPQIGAQVSLGDSTECQSTYEVMYGGKRHVVVTAEGKPVSNCTTAPSGWNTYASTKIYNVDDPERPYLVSRLMLEINAPENCARAMANSSTSGLVSSGFGTAVHYCTPDRLINPTILACGHFLSGLRIFDIRNPYSPKEIAYYNVVSPAKNNGNGTATRPVISTEKGLVYFAVETVGLVVAKLDPNVWPFANTSCPSKDDHLYWQYNKTAPAGCKADAS